MFGRSTLSIALLGLVFSIPVMAGPIIWVTNYSPVVSQFDAATGVYTGSFNAPESVSHVEQYNGSVYLLGQSNAIYQFDSNGLLQGTFIAGTGPSSDVSGFTFAPDGSVYLTRNITNEVDHYSIAGAPLGLFANGPTTPGLHALADLVFSNGVLYVTDLQGQSILQFDGVLGGNATSTSVVPNGQQPVDFALSSNGDVYYSTFGQIYKVGSPAIFASDSSFASLRGLEFRSDGFLYVMSQDTGIERVNGTTGGVLTQFTTGGSVSNTLDFAFVTPRPSAAPEPATAAMVMGALGLCIAFRKKNSK